MDIAEKTLRLKKDFDDVYKAGQSSMVDETKIIKKTVSSEYISVDDVSEIPHEVKVKLTSGGKNLWSYFDSIETEGNGTIYSWLDHGKVDLSGHFVFSCNAEINDLTYSSTGNMIYLAVTFADRTEKYLTVVGSATTNGKVSFSIDASASSITAFTLTRHPRMTGGTIKLTDIMLEQISGENLFDINSSEIVKDAGVAISSGGTYPSSGWNVTHYIPVEGGKQYAWYRSTEVRGIYYSWYDEHKAYISGSGTSTYILTAPSNACYFRFDYPATDTNVTFCELHEPSPYEPFKETLTDYSGVSLTRCGKNLATLSDYVGKTATKNGITATIIEGGIIQVTGTPTDSSVGTAITLSLPKTLQLPAGNYACDPDVVLISNLVRAFFGAYSADGKWIKNFQTEANSIDVPFYASNITVYIKAGTVTTEVNKLLPLTLERGSKFTLTEYEPYNGQTLTAKADGTVEDITSLSPYMYMTTDNPNVTINAEYHKSYGMQTEYDRFWDNFQDYGKRKRYMYAFTEWQWEYAHPKYKVIPTDTGVSQIFHQNSKLKKVEAEYFDFSKVTPTSRTAGNYYSFNACAELEEIEDIGLPPQYYTRTFQGCSKLHTIGGFNVNENSEFDNPFLNCYNLQNIIVNGILASSLSFQWCTLLSKASILSVFNALSSTVTGKTLTLSKTAVTNAFGSTTATEWTNLVATKTNWTISLV